MAVGLGVLAAGAGKETPAEQMSAASAADIEAFTQPGCPHCAGALAFLEVLRRESPETRAFVWDLSRDRQALRRLSSLADQAGAHVTGTPALRVRRTLVIGWRDPESGATVREILAGRGPESAVAVQGRRCPVDLDGEEGGEEAEAECVTAISEDVAGAHHVDVPLLGRIRVEDAGLPAFTLLLGLVDGFNPCAMWVLLFLLSLLVHLRSRAKMLAIAGTFVFVSGLVYFAFMAAWFTFFDVVGNTRIVQVVLGAAAFFVGAIHVKDFFAYHAGLSLSIPESAKPGIYARVTAVLKRNRLTGAILGVVALAFLVNTVELLCTAGLPAVYASILAQHDLPGWQHYGYLALYQVTYMLDDAIVLLVAVVTLSHRRLQESGGRWLKLASGVVIAVIGVLLLFRPEWLYW